MMRLDFEGNKKNYEIKLDQKLKKEINKSKISILSDCNKGVLINIKKIINYTKSKSTEYC